MIRFKKISPALGTAVFGLNLERMNQEDIAEVYELVLQHKYILFDGLQMNETQLCSFAENFGVLTIYPFGRNKKNPYVLEIVNEAHHADKFSSVWHADSTYLSTPPDLTFIYAVKVPEMGGHTVLSNTNLSFETLSPTYQAMINGLNVRNVSNLKRTYSRLEYIGNSDNRTNTETEVFEAIHPAVMVHPETDLRSLYMNQEHTLSFEGMTELESSPILSHLYTHISRHEHTSRIDWKPGMLAVWDNRSTQHRALNDYFGDTRIMRRVTVNRA